MPSNDGFSWKEIGGNLKGKTFILPHDEFSPRETAHVTRLYRVFRNPARSCEGNLKAGVTFAFHPYLRFETVDGNNPSCHFTFHPDLRFETLDGNNPSGQNFAVFQIVSQLPFLL